MNAELPIPFDGWGRMEVDLLCADARVVIELDGPQHLDIDAYGRFIKQQQFGIIQKLWFVRKKITPDEIASSRRSGTRNDSNQKPATSNQQPSFAKASEGKASNFEP